MNKEGQYVANGRAHIEMVMEGVWRLPTQMIVGAADGDVDMACGCHRNVTYGPLRLGWSNFQKMIPKEKKRIRVGLHISCSWITHAQGI